MEWFKLLHIVFYYYYSNITIWKLHVIQHLKANLCSIINSTFFLLLRKLMPESSLTTVSTIRSRSITCHWIKLGPSSEPPPNIFIKSPPQSQVNTTSFSDQDRVLENEVLLGRGGRKNGCLVCGKSWRTFCVGPGSFSGGFFKLINDFKYS